MIKNRYGKGKCGSIFSCLSRLGRMAYNRVKNDIDMAQAQTTKIHKNNLASGMYAE